MGRLFWKFFFFILLAQVTAIIGISSTMWLTQTAQGTGLDTAHEFADRLHMDGPPQPGFDPAHTPSDHGEDRPPFMQGPQEQHGPPDSQQHSFRQRTWLPMTAAFLASLFFAALLAWYMATPLRHLRSAFSSLAEGNLQTRVGSSMGQRRDELADLGHDFDKMAERLGILVESQRRLLHDVSHELRSPLARLQAAIGLARQQPERIEVSLERIEREGMRMDKLVGELLSLSRIEAGVLGKLDAIAMDELLDELRNNASFEAESKNRRFEFLGETKTKVKVMGRYDLLYRAFENVVRNAIKHTETGSCVSLKVCVDDTRQVLQVLVEDDGSGVPEAELQSIFEPFFRIGDSARSSDGYGLGLAIAKRVIHAHGGQISASNRSTGGLAVEIILPLVIEV